MDGRAFLDSARHLLTAPSEANRRSVAGPLSCAVLNEARDALERWGFTPSSPDIDPFVYDRFNNRLSLDLIRVADVLQQMRDFRRSADDSRSAPALFADDREAIAAFG